MASQNHTPPCDFTHFCDFTPQPTKTHPTDESHDQSFIHAKINQHPRARWVCGAVFAGLSLRARPPDEGPHGVCRDSAIRPCDSRRGPSRCSFFPRSETLYTRSRLGSLPCLLTYSAASAITLLGLTLKGVGWPSRRRCSRVSSHPSHLPTFPLSSCPRSDVRP